MYSSSSLKQSWSQTISELTHDPGLLERVLQIATPIRRAFCFIGHTSTIRRQWPVNARPVKIAKASVAVRSSEGELSRHLQQSTAKFLRSESKICRRGISRRACTGTIQRQIRLLRISGTKTIQCMIEEIEGGNAKAEVAFAPETEAFLGGKVRVEESWTLRIGENILTVLPAVDTRQAEAGSIDVLMGS